jgi:hypothetical protein
VRLRAPAVLGQGLFGKSLLSTKGREADRKIVSRTTPITIRKRGGMPAESVQWREFTPPDQHSQLDFRGLPSTDWRVG